MNNRHRLVTENGLKAEAQQLGLQRWLVRHLTAARLPHEAAGLQRAIPMRRALAIIIFYLVLLLSAVLP